MKTLAIFAIVFLAVASASNYYLDANWVAFKQKHAKLYQHSSEEVNNYNYQKQFSQLLNVSTI